MFDSPLDFFLPFVIAVVAFVLALKAFNQAAALRRRVEALEAAAAARALAPPLSPLQEFERTLTTPSPEMATEPPPLPPQSETNSTGSNRTRRAGRYRSASAAAGTCARFRGNHRHKMGGVDRRIDAGARRLLHGALFDRGRPSRPRRAHHARRPVRAGAARGRRMDTPQGKHLGDRGAAGRQHPGDPHRCRNGGRFRNRLCGLCAVRLPRAGKRVHPAWTGRARHARRGAAARTGAGRSRRRRRIRHAHPGLFREARFLGAVHLSRHRHLRLPSASRGSGCGAGLRSPPSCSRCSGLSPACNAVHR